MFDTPVIAVLTALELRLLVLPWVMTMYFLIAARVKCTAEADWAAIVLDIIANCVMRLGFIGTLRDHLKKLRPCFNVG